MSREMNQEDRLLTDEELEEDIRENYEDFRVKDEHNYIQDILIWTKEAQDTKSYAQALKDVGEWLVKQIPDYDWRQKHSTPNDAILAHFLFSEIESLKQGKIPEGEK